MLSITKLLALKKVLNSLNNSRPEHVKDVDHVFGVLVESNIIPKDVPIEKFRAKYEELKGMGEANALKHLGHIMQNLPLDDPRAKEQAEKVGAGIELLAPELLGPSAPAPKSDGISPESVHTPSEFDTY